MLALSNAADQLAQDASRDDWGYPRVWYLAKDLLKRLHALLPSDQCASLITEVFEVSTSIGFVSHLLRDETLGHGFYGDRPDPTDRLTSRDVFETVRQIMLKRYADIGLDVVLSERAASTILYAWLQAGGRAELIELINTHAVDDQWFVRFVHQLCGTSTSTDGTRPTLSLDALQNFFEAPTAVVRRAMALAAAEPPTPGAAIIVEALKRAIHFRRGDFEAVVRAWEQREREEEPLGGG